jgi:hypothetical protein
VILINAKSEVANILKTTRMMKPSTISISSYLDLKKLKDLRAPIRLSLSKEFKTLVKLSLSQATGGMEF